MSGQRDIERVVTDWLTADAPRRAPDGVLSTALDRAGQVGQERGIGLRLGGWTGRGGTWRWVLVLAVLAATLLAVVAGAGALIRRGTIVAPPAVVNGWLAFTEGDRSGRGESNIWLVNADAGEHRVAGAADDGVRDTCPQFSPDGTRLAYTSRSVDDGVDALGLRPAIVIVAVDPHGLRVGPGMRFRVDRDVEACPMWSPDGQSIAFVEYGPAGAAPSLLLGQADGTVETIGPLGETGQVSHLDWSPDGTAIAVTHVGSSRIWLVPVDGRSPRVLHDAGPRVAFAREREDEGARWSPDGSRIAVVAHRLAGESLLVIPVDGGEPPVELGGGSLVGWSPDGQRLAYTRAGGLANQLVVATPSGGDLRVIASITGSIRGLTWAPDGTQVAYVADGNPYPGLAGQVVAAPVSGDGAPVVLNRASRDVEYTTSGDLSWQGIVP